jgi:hypothetical protein
MELKREILDLLNGSTISAHTKNMVLTMLPVMSPDTEQKIYDALVLEAQRNKKLDDKKRRIELKYEVMAQKLVKIQK